LRAWIQRGRWLLSFLKVWGHIHRVTGIPFKEEMSPDDEFKEASPLKPHKLVIFLVSFYKKMCIKQKAFNK